MRDCKEKVTLQINLSPGDYPHARFLLPHQLKLFHDQVDEILLVVESKKSKGNFSKGWDENKRNLDTLLVDIQLSYNCTIKLVDYSLKINQEISKFFFGCNRIPEKDYRGGPFYSYFFGLFQAKHKFVFHIDSDMFFGGGSKCWISEAIFLLSCDKQLLITSPLPGPPHDHEKLFNQNIILKSTIPFSFQLGGASTRIFLLDKSKFQNQKLELQKPGLKSQLKAIFYSNPLADLPENLISTFMLKNNFKRIDFLGSLPGLWSLHPPYRSNLFYQSIESIIERIEGNLIPESQKGYYDIIDDFFDWSEARQKIKKNIWWKRYLYSVTKNIFNKDSKII